MARNNKKNAISNASKESQNFKNCSIQCFIEKLSSTESATTIRIKGNDGYQLEKDGKKYNVFIEKTSEKDLSLRTAMLKEESEEIFIVDSPNNIFQLVLQAFLNHKKVEIDVNLCENSSIKLSKIALL